MAVTSTTVAIAALAVAAAGTGVAIQQGQASAAADRRAAQEEKKRAAVITRRERRRVIRQTRIARGELINQAAFVGAGESSGLAGGLSGLSSQQGAELGFSNQTQGISKNIFDLGIKSNKARSRAAIGQGAASFGSAAFSASGGF